MTNLMDSTGALDRMARMAAAVEKGFTEENSDKIHNVLLGGFRTTIAVSGDLKRSLLHKGNPHHFWVVKPKSLWYGSTLPYAYRAAKYNKIDPLKVAQAVADALFSTLRSTP